MDRKRAHLRISGKVQGVFYRSAARHQAQQLGITGWIRNHYDGSVEVIAEGDESNLKKFIEWCYEGSSASQVKTVDVDWEKYTGKFRTFEITYV